MCFKRTYLHKKAFPREIKCFKDKNSENRQERILFLGHLFVNQAEAASNQDPHEFSHGLDISSLQGYILSIVLSPPRTSNRNKENIVRRNLRKIHGKLTGKTLKSVENIDPCFTTQTVFSQTLNPSFFCRLRFSFSLFCSSVQDLSLASFSSRWRRRCSSRFFDLVRLRVFE